jgi:hypothetical protein
MQNCSVQVEETPHISQHHCTNLKESTPEASSQKQQRYGPTTKPLRAHVQNFLLHDAGFKDLNTMYRKL